MAAVKKKLDTRRSTLFHNIIEILMQEFIPSERYGRVSRPAYGGLRQSSEIIENLRQFREGSGDCRRCFKMLGDIRTLIRTHKQTPMEWYSIHSFSIGETYLITGLIPFYPSIGTIGTNGMLFHW